MTQTDLSYLEKLNGPQREAVEYLDGPELVIAGAGSGKTRVLAYKIVHLLNHGYEPWRIMALTFTNKAAREMRDRVAALVSPEAARHIVMGTFHSVFARFIRQYSDRLGFKSNYTIYDSSDSRNLVKSIIRSMNLDEKIYKPATIASIISTAKNNLMSPEAYMADRESNAIDAACGRPLTGSIYATYANRCRLASALDFDDLLYYMNVLLRDNAEIREYFNSYFRYILVDEYQDTNFAQHAAIRQMCQHQNPGLCVVGDDAQSIYSFRGANIGNILSLEVSFPGIRTFKLEQNYRSTENIINAAGSLIRHNRRQIPKNIFSENGNGEPVEVVRCYSDIEESLVVANRITQLKSAKADSYDDFAILYRTNAQSRVLEESLRKRAIPYRIYGGLSFYQRKEVKDIIAYLRLALNPDDEEAIRRVINFPARGIGDTTVKKLTEAVNTSHVTLWQVVQDPLKFAVNINRGTQNKIQGFVNIIGQAVNMVTLEKSAYDIAAYLMTATGMMDLYQHDKTPENVTKLENLREMLNAIRQFSIDAHEQEGFSTDIDHPDSLAAFMTQVALATDADNEDADDNSSDRVTLMTIHAAKGLEFNNIFIVGVEDDLLPSAMAKTSGNAAAAVEEERRLLYVAITRAKNFCMISYTGQRFRNGMQMFTKPSPFLKEIDSTFLRLSSPLANPPRKTTTYAPKTSASFTFNTPSASTPAISGSGQVAKMSLHSPEELSPGLYIVHAVFGRGRILDLTHSPSLGHGVRVAFDNGEVKSLLLKYARFEIVE